MATQPNNPVAVIRQNLMQMAPEFKAALPAHVPVEKFTRVAMTAIQNNPSLQNADRRSLFGAIVRLAQDGLLPDGREAAIVLFKNQAQAMPMIAGVLKKIRQSGEVSKVSAQVVHELDHFVWKLGFEESVEHVPPALDKPRGKAIGAYAIAVLKDGSQLLEVMSLEEIEQVRKVSRASGNGPWVQWWGEMARKTVMRRLSKRLPMSTDLDDHFDRDETLRQAGERDAPAATVIDGGVAEEPVSRLDALEHHIEDQDEASDSDTGEVIGNDGGMYAGDDEPDDAGDEDPATAKLRETREAIASASTTAELKAVDTDWVNARGAFDDKTAAEIDAEITARRRALAKAQGGEG